MAIIYQDNFDADTIGSLPTGWANIGAASYKVGTVNPVSGGRTLADFPFVPGDIALLTGQAAKADMAVQATQRVNLDGSNNGANLGVFLRTSSDGQNGYLVAPAFNSGGGFAIFKKVAGAYTLLKSTTIGAGIFSDGQYVTLKAECVGTAVHWKTWFLGGTEPYAWTDTVTDSSISAAGYSGLYAGQNGTGPGSTIGAIDDYYLMDAGTSAMYTKVETTSSNGQNIMVLLPPNYNSGAASYLIHYFHGRGEDQTALLSDTLKTYVVQAALNAGYILAGAAAHGTDNWGVQSSVDDYADLDRYVSLNYLLSSRHLWSQSMGGLPGLLALSQNKVPKVLDWLGTYPVCSLNAAYTGAGGGQDFSAAINTAYGITGGGAATYANLTYGQDPLLKAGASFRSVPMRFYASPSDVTVAKSANSDPFAALVSGSSREHTVVVCSGPHGDPSHFQAADYLAFWRRGEANVVPTTGQLAQAGNGGNSAGNGRLSI